MDSASDFERKSQAFLLSAAFCGVLSCAKQTELPTAVSKSRRTKLVADCRMKQTFENLARWSSNSRVFLIDESVARTRHSRHEAFCLSEKGHRVLRVEESVNLYESCFAASRAPDSAPPPDTPQSRRPPSEMRECK